MDMTARKFSLLVMLTLAIAVIVAATPASATEPCCTAGCSGCGGGSGSCSTGLRPCQDCACGCNGTTVKCCCYTNGVWVCTSSQCGSSIVSGQAVQKRRDGFRTILAASTLAGASGLARPSQEEYGVKVTNGRGYPVQIISVVPRVSQDGSEFEGAKVRLQNIGDVPCEAFSVSFIITFTDAETRTASLQEDHAPLGFSKGSTPLDKLIVPRQIYVAEALGLRVPALEPSTVSGIEARLDYVQMANGKTYGNDPDHAGEQMRMMRWGRKAERERLLDVYRSGGMQALVKELERK